MSRAVSSPQFNDRRAPSGQGGRRSSDRSCRRISDSHAAAPANLAETLATFVTIQSGLPSGGWAKLSCETAGCSVPWGLQTEGQGRSFVIANDRDAVTPGRWDGRQLTGQIGPFADTRARGMECFDSPCP
jgi:hypothetical protein